jgi:MFS family permease
MHRRGEFRRRTLGAIPAKLPIARYTLLLSIGMAALYGMVELAAAVGPITFAAFSGFEGLAGLGPAIFLGTAALCAFPAGRAMDRFGRVPVLAGGFGFGVLGCLVTGLVGLRGGGGFWICLARCFSRDGDALSRRGGRHVPALAPS